jgi:hypothetical protein
MPIPSVPPWAVLYETPFDLMEAQPITGGTLYRNTVKHETDSSILFVSMAFSTSPVGSLVAPLLLSLPRIRGAGFPGRILTCDTGEWNNIISLHYQWKSGDVDVGTDQNSYVVQDSDMGQVITCVVTAENAAGLFPAPVSNGIRVV